jgi:hypothetical protein
MTFKLAPFNFAMMSALLRETEEQHAMAEKRLPTHDWQDWYGAYLIERMRGENISREYAALVADDSVKGVRVPASKAVQTDGVTIIDGRETYVAPPGWKPNE